MEQAPQFEQPSKEELTAEIERHLEYIRGLQDEGRMSDDLATSEKERLAAKIVEEYKVVEEKQKLLEML